MGITLTKVVWIGQIQRTKKLERPSFCLRAGHQTMDERHFTDLIHQGMRGVERGRSALGDVGNALASYGATASGIGLSDGHTIDHDVSSGNVTACARISH